MTLEQAVRTKVSAFQGTLSEKDAFEAFLERALGNPNLPLTDERIEYYKAWV
jgi:hypothetical protein